ncbi:MAG: GNAT family N-acetyltransferase [Actinomycetales bacterium]|nr:GNAT family N-acetyltransferase [Actinomycetales bacterium]
MSVRRAVPGDIDELTRLGELYCAADHAQWVPERARRGFEGLLGDDTHGVVLVSEHHGAVVGYAVLTWGWSIECGGRESLLDEMFIELPGQGLGSELLEAVVAAAKEHGAARVFLETEAANAEARDFWLARGFEIEDSVWLQSRW